jgi:hypothetical protein
MNTELTRQITMNATMINSAPDKAQAAHDKAKSRSLSPTKEVKEVGKKGELTLFFARKEVLTDVQSSRKLRQAASARPKKAPRPSRMMRRKRRSKDSIVKRRDIVLCGTRKPSICT